MNDELRRALSAIDGVERSEVEIADNGPLAVRVQLARGADRRAIAERVQRVLEAHGLRSRVAPDRRRPVPDTPPAPPVEPGRTTSSLTPSPGPPVAESSGPSVPPSVSDRIKTVTVSETTEGVVVAVVAGGGRAATRRARRSEEALHEAIVAAVAELIDPEAPSPGLQAVEYSAAFPAVTVYLEDSDGRVRVGASLVAASHPFALALAVWSALQD